MNATATEAKAKFKLGVTLYSFGPEWAAGQYDLESMLAKVDEMGIGPGVEIMASQTVRTYPHILLFPSLFLSLAVLAFILLGDAVRDAFDPKSR